MSDRERARASNRPDATTARRTRDLRMIQLEDECLKKMADEILAEKRRLCRKQEQLANLLREKEQAEGSEKETPVRL
ncbi:hypothetical protein KIN20_020729 [Parelaphostrongylus tenuis]|uniref:Uncharacterized protein n=1 Tax=Parelaphostrongylus tenuis TaxID=148309 RepID=A0AAD5N696_PARTN|nr:hypothetical protein KIN20_020729 [Parelaphostrongylus tenuis]